MEEIEKLQIENDKIRDKLMEFTNYENRDEFQDLLCELIENELEMEDLCNE